MPSTKFCYGLRRQTPYLLKVLRVASQAAVMPSLLPGWQQNYVRQGILSGYGYGGRLGLLRLIDVLFTIMLVTNHRFFLHFVHGLAGRYPGLAPVHWGAHYLLSLHSLARHRVDKNVQELQREVSQARLGWSGYCEVYAPGLAALGQPLRGPDQHASSDVLASIGRDFPLNLSALSQRQVLANYRFRGAGFFSELTAIVDTIAFAICTGMGVALWPPLDPRLHSYYLWFLAILSPDLGPLVRPLDGGTLQSDPFASAVDFSVVYGWQRNGPYRAVKLPALQREVPLHVLRSSLIQLVLPLQTFKSVLGSAASAFASPLPGEAVFSATFLRFGDKIGTEDLALSDAQIAATLSRDIVNESPGVHVLVSDDNRRAELIYARLRRMLPESHRVIHSFCCFREGGYRNSGFATTELVGERREGLRNIFHNLSVLLQAQWFSGNTMCNLVNAAALYCPKGYQPTLLHPWLPI